MTRVPAHPIEDDAAEAQIEAAFARLIKLMAQQTARERAASAPDAEEPSHDDEDVLED